MTDPTSAPAVGGRARRHTRSRRRAWPWWVGAGVLLVLVLATAALFARDAATMLRASDGLTEHARAAKEAVEARDAAALESQVDGLEVAAREFAGATRGPHWWLAAHTPWVADQARPLIAAGDAVDAMATEALAPLAAMGSLDALAMPGFEGGRIDPQTLEPYREPLAHAAAALTAQEAALADVSLAHTVDRVATPFLDLREQIAALGELVGSAHVAAELLPAMAGGEGDRTYAVMIQNNAEPRATGGISGAVISITVADGRISLGEYRSAGDLYQESGVGGLTKDERRIFSDQMEIFAQDVNFTPEYPRSAELMTRFWAAAGGGDLDGVISVDPVALGWMLEGTEPVALGPFEITGDNLADVMLRDSYLEFTDPADQDAFFARASAELFGRIVSGDASTLDGVERAIDAGRLMVWSADEAEQALLVTTPISGGFLERDDALGVFVNDGSGSKIGYYVDTAVTVTDLMCPDGAIAGQEVEVTFTHTFDGDPAELPEYVSGGGIYAPLGAFHANVVIYPAVGTGVAGSTLDGEEALLRPETHAGRPMATSRVELAAGGTATLRYEIVATERGVVPPALALTPGPRETQTERSVRAATAGC